jgi:hypothetical protein
MSDDPPELEEDSAAGIDEGIALLSLEAAIAR